MDSAGAQLDAIREFLSRPAGAALEQLAPASLTPDPGKPRPITDRFFLLRRPDAGRLSIRFDQHLDLSLDGFVVDSRLGTIGLLVILGDTKSAPKEVEETIEKAAYLRHILGQKRAESIESNLLPYAIEVLFVCTESHDETSAIVGDAVRESWRETTLPHALGIGFAHLLPQPDERQLRRAFCWLLTATQVWLKKLDPLGAVPGPKWSRLQLENFRRFGTRTWTKTNAGGLHVLHGANGSGKSSLVEAFEFLVTGHSARLGPPPATPAGEDSARFRPLVWQPAGGGAPTAVATVRLFAEGDKNPSLQRSTTPHATDAIGEHPPPADAFRLNQPLADRLMLQSAGERARTWLDAFFPGADQLRRQRREARAALQQSIAPPETIAANEASSPAGALIQLAERLAAGTGVPLADFVRELIGADNFARLQSLSSPELKSRAALEDILFAKNYQLDNPGEIHERLKTSFTADAILLARWHSLLTEPLVPLLQRLGEDPFASSPTAPGPATSRPEAFNHWLRHVALADLHERALAVATVAAALPENERATVAAITPPQPPAAIEQRRDEFRAQRDEARKEITTLDTDKTRLMPVGHASTRVQEADAAPLLTAIAGGLFSPMLQPTDEPAVRTALRQRKLTSVRELHIGLRHWTSSLLSLVNQRQEAVKRFVLLTGDPQQAPSRAQSLIDLVQSALQVAAHDTATASQLVSELVKEGLDAAIDELVALFTPARWAYPPLATEFTETDAGDQLQLRTIAQHDAKAILNTAELNTVALALYLLCAPRVGNPYHVVFLDDPLQNMDELTVTTVGRGLARLLRMWRGHPRLQDWDVVLLLHGAEDCARIAREGPTSLYAFPWLTPSNVNAVEPSTPSADDDVISLPGTRQGELQPLDSLFAAG